MGYEIDSKKAAKVIHDLASLQGIGNEVRATVRRTPTRVILEFLDNERTIAGFTLIEQPNCCGVLISTRTFVAASHQKQGIAQAMMPVKDAIAREFGYSCLSATVNITGNPAEVHILQKCGWTPGLAFVNKRTKNSVQFFHKILL